VWLIFISANFLQPRESGGGWPLDLEVEPWKRTTQGHFGN